MTAYRRPGPGQTGSTPEKDRTGPWEVKVRTLAGNQVVRRIDPRTGEKIRGLRHAQQVETYLLNEVHAPAPASDTITLREFCRTRWWPDHVMVNVGETTRPNFAMHLDQNILSVPVPVGEHGATMPLGDMPIADIRVSTVDAMMAALQRRGKRPPTVNRARTVLSSILGKAVRWEVIPANPVSATSRSKEVKKRRRYLTLPEVLQVAEECRSLRDRTMVLLAYFTGLRPSELLGLTLEHIHLDAPQPHITVAWQMLAPTLRDGKRVRPARLKAPKDHETGDLELPQIVVDALTEYLAAGDPHPPITSPDGVLRLAFAQADGSPLVLHTWRRSCFTPAALRVGLAEPVLDADGSPAMTPHVPGRSKPKPKQRCMVTPHDLRHGFASLCRSLPGGVGTPDYVCARMRHSDQAFTLREYGDLWATPAAPVIAAIDAAVELATA